MGEGGREKENGKGGNRNWNGMRKVELTSAILKVFEKNV